MNRPVKVRLTVSVEGVFWIEDEDDLSKIELSIRESGFSKLNGYGVPVKPGSLTAKVLEGKRLEES